MAILTYAKIAPAICARKYWQDWLRHMSAFVYDGVIGAFRVVGTLTGIADLVYVRAASTVNLGATYDAGTLTAAANGALVLDQVALVATNRVLIKNQSTLAHNGIYDVVDPGDETHPFILTRSSDCDSAEDLAAKPVIVVTEGVANVSTGLQLLSNGDIELGVTGLRFSQFTGGVSGVTADQLDAIGLAASPSASNVFATMDDLDGLGGGSSFTADQSAAVTGATTPSATNVFVTVTDTGWVSLGSATGTDGTLSFNASDWWSRLIDQSGSGYGYKEFLFVATLTGNCRASVLVPYQEITHGYGYFMYVPGGQITASATLNGNSSVTSFTISGGAYTFVKVEVYGRYGR